MSNILTTIVLYTFAIITYIGLVFTNRFEHSVLNAIIILMLSLFGGMITSYKIEEKIITYILTIKLSNKELIDLSKSTDVN